MNESPPPARFPTTHWSRIARAGGPPTPELRAALDCSFFPADRRDRDAASRTAVAADLGLSDGNLRLTLHRLRARFAARLREEVAATLRDAGDEATEEELRALRAVLGA